MGNSVNSLVFYQLRNLLNQAGFINHIRNFCDNDPVLSIWHGFNVAHGTYPDLSTPGSVSFVDSCCTKNLRTCRKIRTLYNIQHFIDASFSVLFNTIINNLYYRTNNLPQVVGRNIGCHTNGNTGSSICQKVRISGRQYRRLFLRLIKVRYKINRIFVNVCQHLHGNLA